MTQLGVRGVPSTSMWKLEVVNLTKFSLEPQLDEAYDALDRCPGIWFESRVP